MGAPLRVLLVEDSEDDGLLILRELRRGGFEAVCERVETAKALGEALADRRWDIVISDYALVGFDGFAALRQVRASDPELPFILVSGTIGEDLAVEAMRSGARDYVMKDRLARLGPAVERELRESEGRGARRRAEEAYRTLVENSLQGLAIVQDGGVVFANAAVADMLGWSVAELMSLSSAEMRQILRPEDWDRLWSQHRDRLAGKAVPVRYEVRMRRRDGRLRWIEVLASRVEFAGRPAIQAALADVTDRLGRAREERAIATVATALRAAARRSDLVCLLADQVASLFAADGVALATRDASGTMVCEAARGVWADLVGVSLPMDEEATGAAFAAGQAFVSNDGANRTSLPSPELRPLPPSLIGVPLIVGDETTGVLWVGREGEVSDDDAVILTAIGEMTASAIRRISLHAELRRSNLELTEAYDSTLEGWARALELRDSDTEGHTRRVTAMAVRLGQALGWDPEALAQLRRGALLHDIGKIAIPDRILRKPGPLEQDEWALMRMHPVHAREMLSEIGYLRPAIDIPYCHHERWDGKGYPSGWGGEQIPMAARIFAVVDVYDALCSDRPYRKAWTPQRALDYLRAHSGRRFDPEVVGKFLEMLGEGG